MNNDKYLSYIQGVPPTKRILDIWNEKEWSPLLRLWVILRRVLYLIGFICPPIPLFLLKRQCRFRSGVRHFTGDLGMLLKEALYLNCAPVISPYVLSPQHNFGKKVINSVSDYYNLSDSFLITSKGEKKQLNYIFVEDFFRRHFNLFSLRKDYQIHFFSPKDIISPPPQHKR